MTTKGRNGKKFVKIHDNKMSTYGKQLWQEIVSRNHGKKLCQENMTEYAMEK